MFQIIGRKTEFERELIRERVKAGMKNARAKPNSHRSPTGEGICRPSARPGTHLASDCKPAAGLGRDSLSRHFIESVLGYSGVGLLFNSWTSTVPSASNTANLVSENFFSCGRSASAAKSTTPCANLYLSHFLSCISRFG